MTILPDTIGYLADYTLYMTESHKIYFHPLIPWMPVLWSSLSIHLEIIFNPFCPLSGAKSVLLIVLFNYLGKPSCTKISFFNIVLLSFYFFLSFCFFFLETKYFETEIFSNTKFSWKQNQDFFLRDRIFKKRPKQFSETKFSETETETLKKFANVSKSRSLKCQSA